MTTSFLTSTRRTLVGALLSTAALTAMASPALAIPNNNNNDPNNPPPPPPPIAKFTITPNPVVENGGVLQVAGGLGDIGGIHPVKAAAALVRGVKFDASGSAGAGINKYDWDLDGDGSYETHSTQPVVYKKYPTAGTYHVRLIVEGTNGESQAVTHDLLVHKAPKAAIAASLAAPLIGQQVSFSAAGSSDDNGIAKYQWDLDGDGTFETNSGATSTASASYQTLGKRKVQVRVTDIYGATGTASVNVDVNRAPTAAFTFAPSPAVVGETVQFDGSSSADDEPIADYAWDLDGNGSFETDSKANPKTTMKYTTPGTINVRLRVTDSHGVQDVVTRPVQVLAQAPRDNTAPRVRISPRSVKMSGKGFLSMKVLCPQGERSCSGRLALSSLLRSAHGSKLGAGSFRVGGGQSATVKIHLSRKNQRLVKSLRKLSAQATATAKDAAGNSGTSKARVTIKR